MITSRLPGRMADLLARREWELAHDAGTCPPSPASAARRAEAQARKSARLARLVADAELRRRVEAEKRLGDIIMGDAE